MDFEPNPWNVISIEAFHFYNCPECEDKYVTKEQFVGHAMISHQKARVPLLAILDEKIQISTIESVPDIKQETSTEQDPICTEKIKNWSIAHGQGFCKRYAEKSLMRFSSRHMGNF